MGMRQRVLSWPASTIDWGDRRPIIEAFRPCSGRIVTVLNAVDNLIELQLTLENELIGLDSAYGSHALYWLKWRALEQLHPDRRFNLLGIHPAGRRIFEYHALRASLPVSAQGWWDQHETQIREGILYTGSLESAFQIWWKRMTRLVGPWRWDMTPDEHQAFVSKIWGRPRWRLFERLYPVPWLETWKVQVSRRIPQGLYWMPPEQGGLAMGADTPHTLSKIPQAPAQTAESVTIVHSEMQAWLLTQPKASISGIYLGEGASDISPELLTQVYRVLEPDGRVIIWSHQIPNGSRDLQWMPLTEDYDGFLVGQPWIAIK